MAQDNYFVQIQVTAMEPNNARSYADITVSYIDK